ncbi:hypothetical protein GQ53DRAFT_413791 [Thozetella sp. PMI_491]|nr:hypothetical protein GQ53DRAFT_413791 [Thozetella sp. PMI_491]
MSCLWGFVSELLPMHRTHQQRALMFSLGTWYLAFYLVSKYSRAARRRGPHPSLLPYRVRRRAVEPCRHWDVALNTTRAWPATGLLPWGRCGQATVLQRSEGGCASPGRREQKSPSPEGA